MDNKTQQHKIIRGLLLAIGILYLACLIGVFLWVDGWLFQLLLVLGVSLCLWFCLSVFMQMRRSVVDFTSIIAKDIDDLISGQPISKSNTTTESLTGKIQVKLQRLYQIMQKQADDNLKDKQNIQSLVSDISHQVKTPIANIKMVNNILKEREIPKEKQAEFYEAMTSQVNKLDFLVQALIKMSRLETGIIQVLPHHLPLDETMQDAIFSVGAAAKEKNITIENCIGNSQALHDPKWTAEAIGNILDNAVKYSPSRSAIEITAQHQEFFTRIYIKDQGKGIDESRQAEIFKRFYREPEVQDAEGIGIGLYLAREIISMQNGMLEVRSDVGQGSVFVISLPNE